MRLARINHMVNLILNKVFNTKVKKISLSVMLLGATIFSFLQIFVSSPEGALFQIALNRSTAFARIVAWFLFIAAIVTILISVTIAIIQLFNFKVKIPLFVNLGFSLLGMIFTLMFGTIGIGFAIGVFAFSLLATIYEFVYELKNKDLKNIKIVKFKKKQKDEKEEKSEKEESSDHDKKEETVDLDVDKKKESKKIEKNEEPEKAAGGNLFCVLISIVSLICLSVIFFIPVYFVPYLPNQSLVSALSVETFFQLQLTALVSFVVFFLLYLIVVLQFTRVLFSYKKLSKLLMKTRKLIYTEFIITIVFFIYSIIINLLFSTTTGGETLAISMPVYPFVPLVILGVITVINSAVSGHYANYDESVIKNERSVKLRNRLLALSFALGFAALLVGSLFSNLLIVTYSYAGVGSSTVTVNGLEILKNYTKMEEGYKLLAFFIYVIVIFSAANIVISLSLFFRKSAFFYKYEFMSVCVSFLLLVVLSLFGKYYEIVEGIQGESLKNLLEAKGYHISIDYESEVKSQTVYFAIGGMILLVAMTLTKPFSKNIDDEAIDVNINNDLSELKGEGTPAPIIINNQQPEPIKEEEKEEEEEQKEPEKPKDFDACPAFTEIDSYEEIYTNDINNRKLSLFVDPKLPGIVRFIVDYARNSRLHLSYKEEDIAQFIAGLGSSRLAILQGMSGTGKTSLPKIFTEALFGNCEIIEVESSWKDKNELIGYYNEFSAKFTPKKFTQSLYRAKFMPEAITLIVLDEMNLSRIEYYFSDFLSLMENEEDKREFQLLNVQLKAIKDGEYIDYKQLVHGHTLKIPTNVWFIGTANRDESTFEISDKVYDRAMTMNFTKRAPKVKNYGAPMDRHFLRYQDFKQLLDASKTNYHFDCEGNSIVKEVEKIVAPFNISFGNRILNQIEAFVSVYCSCFENPSERENEALEKILLTKVVQKLETKSIENKEELVHSFEKIGLLDCAEFISKLNEGI